MDYDEVYKKERKQRNYSILKFVGGIIVLVGGLLVYEKSCDKPNSMINFLEKKVKSIPDSLLNNSLDTIKYNNP